MTLRREPVSSVSCGQLKFKTSELCYLCSMSNPSEIESTVGQPAPSEKETEASSIAWKRNYKGHTITIFGSQRLGWNVQIHKREPIILGYARAHAIKYSKQLIDAEQAKWHTRSTGGTPRNPALASKAIAGSTRLNRSFSSGISSDRRRG